MGRPTLYTPDIAQKLIDYIDRCVAEKLVPYAEKFAYEANITVDNMNDWEKSNDDFSQAYKKLKMVQKYMLMDGSVHNKLNPASSIFQLKANHGMIETEKKVLSTDPDNPIQINIGPTLDKIYGGSKSGGTGKMPDSST